MITQGPVISTVLIQHKLWGSFTEPNQTQITSAHPAKHIQILYCAIVPPNVDQNKYGKYHTQIK